MHLPCLGEEEERDEAAEGADGRREQDQLRVMALQDLIAGKEHGYAPFVEKDWKTVRIE
jgi:hypothetical protein